MNKLTEIYDGWKNLVFQNPEFEIIAKERMEICVKNKCKKYKHNNFCTECGCFMPAKVRNPKSKCNLGFW